MVLLISYVTPRFGIFLGYAFFPCLKKAGLINRKNSLVLMDERVSTK